MEKTEMIADLTRCLIECVEAEFREGNAGIHETVQRYHDVYAWADRAQARAGVVAG